MDDVPRQFKVCILLSMILATACVSSSQRGFSVVESDALRKELKAAQAEAKKWKKEVRKLSARGLHLVDPKNKDQGRKKASPTGTQFSSLPRGEHLLYSNVIASYRQGKLVEAEYSLQLLLKAYPKSVHADNALFLVARLAAYNDSIQKGTQYLDRLLRDYPMGNKVGAALLEKGRFLRQEGKIRQAKNFFNQVVEKFPESLEANDAGEELEKIM
jgi:TolA-binding protein